MPDPRVPKFRVPAAFVSPAALCLVGGICYFFTLDFTTDEEKNSAVGREFRHAVRTTHEVDERMKEFFRRVNNNDPREEERMRNLLNKGKGNYYNMKRHHATAEDIEEFGFVPKQSQPAAAAPSPSPSCRWQQQQEQKLRHEDLSLLRPWPPPPQTKMYHRRLVLVPRRTGSLRSGGEDDGARAAAWSGGGGGPVVVGEGRGGGRGGNKPRKKFWFW